MTAAGTRLRTRVRQYRHCCWTAEQADRAKAMRAMRWQGPSRPGLPHDLSAGGLWEDSSIAYRTRPDPRKQKASRGGDRDDVRKRAQRSFDSVDQSRHLLWGGSPRRNATTAPRMRAEEEKRRIQLPDEWAARA